MLRITTHNDDSNLIGCVDVDCEERHSLWHMPLSTITAILGEPNADPSSEYLWWISAETTDNGLGYFALRMASDLNATHPRFHLVGDVRPATVTAVEAFLIRGFHANNRPKHVLVIGRETKLPLPDRRYV